MTSRTGRTGSHRGLAKGLTAGCALVLGSAALIGGPVLAQAEPGKKEHSVVGVFSADGANPDVFDAYIDKRGDPQGTVYGQLPDENGSVFSAGGLFTLERVVCLVVEGNRATVATQILSTNHPTHSSGYQIYSLIDNGATGDLVGGGFVGNAEPTCEIDHSDPPAGYTPVADGGVTID